jgi:opacity protein-like surface antigen
MVKHVVIATSLLLMFVSAAYAGQSGEYYGLSTGAMYTKTGTVTDRNGATGMLSYNTGIPVSAYLGHQFGVGLRLEGEAFYKHASTDEFKYSNLKFASDSKVNSVGVMSNLYYDFYHNEEGLLAHIPFSPYVGLGAGFASVSMSEGVFDRKTLWNSGNDTVFAYQIAIGSGIPIGKNLNLDVSYRYFGTSDVKIGPVKTDFNNSNIVVGVRYSFR